MIRITPLPGNLSMRDPAVLIATGLGSGRLTPASGTWGTLAAWVLALFLLSHGKVVLILALLAAVIAGFWAIEKYEAASNDHDSGTIVIDEWAGIWLTLLFAAPFWDHLLLSFLLFRLFDIWKPWPIRWLERNISGPSGVIVDDLAAGLLAGICVYGYATWI